jgi:hypothetical protein
MRSAAYENALFSNPSSLKLFASIRVKCSISKIAPTRAQHETSAAEFLHRPPSTQTTPSLSTSNNTVSALCLESSSADILRNTSLIEVSFWRVHALPIALCIEGTSLILTAMGVCSSCLGRDRGSEEVRVQRLICPSGCIGMD